MAALFCKAMQCQLNWKCCKVSGLTCSSQYHSRISLALHCWSSLPGALKLPESLWAGGMLFWDLAVLLLQGDFCSAASWILRKMQQLLLMNPAAARAIMHWQNSNILEGFLYAVSFLERNDGSNRGISLCPPCLSCQGPAGGTVLLCDLFNWRWHFSLFTEAGTRKDLLPIKPLFLLMQLEVWCLFQELSVQRIPHGHVCLNIACGYSFLQTAEQKSKCQ